MTVPYLLIMITRQYRMVLQLKILQDRKLSTRELMAKVGISRDFVLEKALQQASRYSVAGVEEVYNKLLELDLAVKTGLAEGTVAMEILVAELSSGRSVRA